MIGKILKTMRLRNNLTQQIVAKNNNIAISTLSGYENGYREPNFQIIEQLANYYGYNVFFQKNNDILTTKNINRKEL